MKAKTFSKKLVLNKKTIANLNNNEMKKINGGWIATKPSTGPWKCCI
jgi:bacteriocin-like protein